MLRIPLIATPIVVVMVAVGLPLMSFEFVSVSIAAALTAAVGAWCAPASYVPGETGSLLSIAFDVWDRRLARLKALQLAVAGAVVLLLVGLELVGPATAAVFGIAAAIAVGAFSGSSAERSGSTNRSSCGATHHRAAHGGGER